MRKILILHVAALLLSLCASCATPIDVMTARNGIVENENRNAAESSKEHAAMTTGDMQKAVTDLASQNNLAIAAIQKQFSDELATEVKKREDAINAATGVIQTLSSLGGPLAEGITKQAINAVVPMISSQIDPVKQTATAAQQTATTAQDKANAAQQTSTDAQKTASSAQMAAASAQQTADQANKMLASLNVDQNELKKKYDSLDQGIRDKFSAFQSDDLKRIQDIQSQLSTNNAEAVSNLDKLLAARGLTPDQIRQLHDSSSPTEIIGFILTALAGAGGGAGLAKVGKSRAAGQVDALTENDQAQNQQLNQMQAKVTSLDATTTARNTHEPRIDSAEAQLAALKAAVDAKADHDRITGVEHAVDLVKQDIKRQGDQLLTVNDYDKRLTLLEHTRETENAESKRQSDEALRRIEDLKKSVASVNAAIAPSSRTRLGTQITRILKRLDSIERQLGDVTSRVATSAPVVVAR